MHLDVQAVKFRKAGQVGADQDLELAPLLLALRSIPRVALVLHPYPQLVHLRKVEQDKIDRVLQSTTRSASVLFAHQLKGKGKKPGRVSEWTGRSRFPACQVGPQRVLNGSQTWRSPCLASVPESGRSPLRDFRR